MAPLWSARATSPPSDLGGRRVDIDLRALQRLVVGLAHREIEGADEIEMRAGLQPRALDDRRGRQGRAGDEIGLPHGGFEILTSR